MKKKQYAFYFDSSSCSGCKACQVACKDKHDLDVGMLWRRVYEVGGGDWIEHNNVFTHNVFAYNLSISCNHCENPSCVAACPSKALQKRKDGIVFIDEEKCIGCKYCAWACPYDALKYDTKKGVMSKCHFCYDNIDKVEKPTCVAACPMRALEFGELSELKKRYGSVNEIYPLPESSLTNPSIVITPHRDAVSTKGSKASISNTEKL